MITCLKNAIVYLFQRFVTTASKKRHEKFKTFNNINNENIWNEGLTIYLLCNIG